MRSGALRHRVAIQRATETLDAFGQTSRAWATLATVWASIEPTGGSETVKGRAIRADQTHEVRMRHTDCTTGDRLTLGARVLNIVAVVNVAERDRELRLAVQEAA